MKASDERRDGYVLCRDCGQPLLPPGETKLPNEYDHASGCPREAGVYVDRIDGSGNIREHVIGPKNAPGRDGWLPMTLCGLVVADSQKPAGNRPCKRCAAQSSFAAQGKKQ